MHPAVFKTLSVVVVRSVEMHDRNHVEMQLVNMLSIVGVLLVIIIG